MGRRLRAGKCISPGCDTAQCDESVVGRGSSHPFLALFRAWEFVQLLEIETFAAFKCIHSELVTSVES